MPHSVKSIYRNLLGRVGIESFGQLGAVMSSGLGLPIYRAGRVCLALCRFIARLVGLPVVLVCLVVCPVARGIISESCAVKLVSPPVFSSTYPQGYPQDRGVGGHSCPVKNQDPVCLKNSDGVYILPQKKYLLK